MSEYSSFFNSVVDGAGIYDREYTAENFAEYFSSFIGNGVYANNTNKLMPLVERNTMNVVVTDGSAWINGYYYKNTSVKSLTLNIADGALNRTDLIVIRLDLLERKITAEVVEGTPDTVGTVPELTRDANIYEIALAKVYIPANASYLVPANLTDLRGNNTYCGWVSGVIDQIDTTGLFNQFTDAFETWFDRMKGQLDTDAAGHLQNEIDAMETTVNNAIQKMNTTITAQFLSTKWTTKKTVNGTQYFTNTVSLNYVLSDHPDIGIIPTSGTLPTDAEQDAYNSVNYFVVEPIYDPFTEEVMATDLVGYALAAPTASFSVVVKGLK